MNENTMDNTTDIAESVLDIEESVTAVEDYGTDGNVINISDSGSASGTSTADTVTESVEISEPLNGENLAVDGVTSETAVTQELPSSVVYEMNLEYDEELGGYPVVIINDVSEDYGIATLSLADEGTEGYQVSEYWLNYFRGVLQKMGNVDYLVFATRDSSSGYNYVTHYWMYVGDIENGGEITVYDCYSSSNIYYVDVSTETIDGIDIDSYGTLAYSNLGHISDLRDGGGYVGNQTVLFFLGFFAVYTVCHGIFDNILRRVYRK